MPSVLLKELKRHLGELADPEKAKVSMWFFKTGPGEYGEGDKFLGIRVPELRSLSKKFKTLTTSDTIKLLRSEYHEERLLSLFILIHKYKNASVSDQKNIYDLYIKNLKYVNNWDLVDSSAPHIVGSYLEDKSKDILFEYAVSENLWERRVSILSTHYYIKRGNFDTALQISKLLLNDDQDLIHKAVGWMIREIGKRDIEVEKAFLKEHYKSMPRTMLRYAIERFPATSRKEYLAGTVS